MQKSAKPNENAPHSAFWLHIKRGGKEAQKLLLHYVGSCIISRARTAALTAAPMMSCIISVNNIITSTTRKEKATAAAEGEGEEGNS